MTKHSAFFSVFSVSLWLIALYFSLHFRRIAPSRPLHQHKIRTAADTAEPAAAPVSFQRHQPSIPPTKNINSAPSSLTAARHFSGFIAQFAVNVNHGH